MQCHRLYRGQSNEFRYKPFVPSALRQDCIDYMEYKILCSKKKDVECWRKECNYDIPGIRKWLYEDCSKRAFYAYWLSLMTCTSAVIKNEICLTFCNSQFFTGWEKDKKVVYGIQPEYLASQCFERAKAFFDTDEKDFQLRFHEILHDYAFFQHFNYALCKLDKNCLTKILFPTLILDWTWDISRAERFAGKDGNILSISSEAYKNWISPRRVQIPSSEQPGTLHKIIIPGLDTYRNAPFWGGDEYTHSWDNNLMIEQKGAVIFWPWDYTIDELLSNKLGRNLDFRLER